MPRTPSSAALTVLFLLGLGVASGAQAQVSFTAAPTAATGDTPVSVALGDFDGDGNLDLAVTNSDDDTVSILLGNGDGTFRAKTDFATGFTPVSVAIGDLDGDLDLVVANRLSAGPPTVSVLLGNGDGSFGAQTTFATGDTPNFVALGDLDGDGDLDIAVANEADNTVSILLGNGDGTFGAQTTFATGNTPNSVALGDLDGDGDLDIAVANEADNTVSILLGNGDGTFGAQTTFATGFTPVSVGLGDSDGDGNLDLAVTNSDADTVSILLGNGDGTFGAQTTFATGFTPVFIALGDLDGDGNLDLVVANRLSAGPPTVSILLGNGNGTFEPKTDFATGNTPVSVALGDLDGDGDLDIAVANEADNTISILLNTPAAAPPAPGGGGGGGCFIATAAFGSALAPQVQLLRDFRDRFLLPNSAGKIFVKFYYATSPPLAEVIAESEALRAIVRAGLVPIIGWAALLLWSPALGLGILLVALAFASWLAFGMAQQNQWARARRIVPHAGKVTRSHRTALWRRPVLWGCVIFILSAATIVQASPGEETSAPVKLVAMYASPR